MSKKLKILLILLISFVLVSFSTSTYAVNMDLTDDEGSTSNEETSNTSNTANTGNTASSENTSNTSTNEASNSSNNTTNSVDSENTNTTSNTSSIGNKTTTPPVTQTVAGSQSSGELQISDILNILLIVIGVLLILLGIAILIRLKK